MSLLHIVLRGLPAAALLAACTDGAPVAVAPHAACATPPIEAWTGEAGRTAEMYPDDIAARITWRLVDSVGCVDRYAPDGDASYTFAIPGAICRQTIAPADRTIDGASGSLSIDRSTSPATYTGRAATTWSVTWSCTQDDGTVETMAFDAGGRWFEASGTLDGAAIAGTRVEPDGAQCGQGQSTLPCTYTWSFESVE